jgi:ubiquinone/menaquinone biosynthesis C-methylase UbiE
MTRFLDKVLAGEAQTDEDWNEHLLEAHARSTGCTPAAFARHLSLEGVGSYEKLAHEIEGFTRRDLRVLDLACGDGHLADSLLPWLNGRARYVGLDMSEAELARAREKVSDSRAHFLKGIAQKIPFPDASFDLVLCHMALMLMLPLEPVILEISRVLRPGGRFAAVVGRQSEKGSTSHLITEIIIAFLKSRYPRIGVARTGDPRVRDRYLPTLFEAGFTGRTRVEDFALQAKVSSREVWDYYSETYLVGALAEADRGALRERIIGFASTLANEKGRLTLDMPMSFIAVTR